MFRFFLENKLTTLHQSGFTPDDSCMNQLLSITHEIYKSFDDGLVRSIFVDTSKAFDKVMYDGVIFKLEQNFISGDLLNIQVSAWASVNAGVPQGSILGLFIIISYLYQ